jgi:hypothetical protein
MMSLSRKSVFLLALLICLPLLAQHEGKPPVLPKIHFTFDHPELAIAHYELDIDANGKAHYESRIKGQEKGTTEDGMTRDFTLSAETRDRLFALIKAANNLDGTFDYTKHKIAFTGTKTITFTDIDGTHTAKLVWTENPTVTQLTDLLQGVSGTLEEEPVLQRLRKYDPLGLNLELAKMEKMANSGWLRELNLIAPTLKDIASDGNIMGMARKRAERLLQKASVTSRNET